MKILIIAMSDSIHTARWLSQISDQGWEIHLFPCIDNEAVHPDIANLTIYHSFYGHQSHASPTVKRKGIFVFSSFLAMVIRFYLRKYMPNYRANQLARTIRKLQPDVIHTMETQQAGYLMLEAQKGSNLKMPPWVHTIWGSDIYLFGRLPEHRGKIDQILERCDYYSCECNRDVALAREHGFRGKTSPCFPITGGFDLEKVKLLRKYGDPSKRKYIIVKGYQNWAGRALVALQALRRCADILKNYTVLVYAIQKNEGLQLSDVEISARLLAEDTGCKVEFVYSGTPYEKMLECFSKSRIYIGLSISDGISVSMLEALVTGAFPIQSNTSCANEWITDGVSGFTVPPEDPEKIEEAIRKALNDDKLVDSAAVENWSTAQRRLTSEGIKQQTVDFYVNIFSKLKATEW